jgi:hypothetical protein
MPPARRAIKIAVPIRGSTETSGVNVAMECQARVEANDVVESPPVHIPMPTLSSVLPSFRTERNSERNSTDASATLLPGFTMTATSTAALSLTRKQSKHILAPVFSNPEQRK